MAIASLRVLGCVEYARILAGVDASGDAKNADAQVGLVSVSGDWIASSLAAAAVPGHRWLFLATGATPKVRPLKDEAGISSRIASRTIGGSALGTPGGAVTTSASWPLARAEPGPEALPPGPLAMPAIPSSPHQGQKHRSA